MLHIIWNAGVKGRLWRLLKSFSEDLTAIIKTRYGPLRVITRENGGRQGSSLMGFLFSKQMDTHSENCISNPDENVKINQHFSIGSLLWVDDLNSATIGINNQHKVLEKADEFAKINKLEWGEKKCEVMQVGKKSDCSGYMEVG